MGEEVGLGQVGPLWVLKSGGGDRFIKFTHMQSIVHRFRTSMSTPFLPAPRETPDG